MKWFIIITLVGALLYLIGTHSKESKRFLRILIRIGKQIVNNAQIMFSTKNSSQMSHSKENDEGNSVKISIEMEQLRKELLNISVQTNRLQKDLNDMEISQKELYNNCIYEISWLKENIESLKLNPDKKVIENSAYNNKELLQQTLQEESNQRLFYATDADSISPLGFSVSRLSSKYSGQYFEIERISANDALYRIVNDRNIHKLIIPTMYQMVDNGICEIGNKLNTAPTYIETSVDGHLKLKNEILEITNKVIIKIA